MALNSEVFTQDQMKACKAITNLYETGTFIGKAWALVVLEDGAGITYGKSQTTENAGGLWKLLFEAYTRLDGKYADEFKKYKEILYQKGGSSQKKFALTKNEKFKELLIRAGQEDPIMGEAQDEHFDNNYFTPALWICEEFGMTEPLTLAFVYDFCIHSGPGSRFNDGLTFNRLTKWDDEFTEPEEGFEDDVSAERYWLKFMCKKRDAFLKSSSRRSVNISAYRTGSFLKMMEEGDEDIWYLGVPTTIDFLRKDYTGRSDLKYTLKQEHLDNI